MAAHQLATAGTADDFVMIDRGKKAQADVHSRRKCGSDVA